MDQNVCIYRENEQLFTKVKLAKTFWTKLRGLMIYPEMPGIDGLLLYPCNFIHMFWMQFPLDLIYLSRDQKVLFKEEVLVPNKFGPLVKEAYYVLEIGAGMVAAKNIRIGDRIRWE